MIPLPNHNTYWVIPGQFMAGEYPRDHENKTSREKLAGYLERGVSFFLDLTEPGEYGLRPYRAMLNELAAERGKEVAYHRLPIVDSNVPEPAFMRRILATIDDALLDGHTVYVHCWGGIGRTGTVVATYLTHHGQTADASLAQLAEWWTKVEKSTRHPRSPENDLQEAFVRSWAR